MDPITIIVTALAVGAAAGLKSTAEQVVKDAYAGLKTLVIRKFGDSGDVTQALESLEKEPDSNARRSVAAEKLESVGASHDVEIIEAAKRLLEKAERVVPFGVPRRPPQGVFGREGDLKILSELLALDDPQQKNVAPMAIRGMGGIGKTTLAIELAWQEALLTRFPDGVLWTQLGPSPIVRSRQNSWGELLGVDLTSLPTEEACSDHLRSVLYHRRMVLIVDDVWEVVHGKYFLIGGPSCRTILTTRESPIANALVGYDRVYKVKTISPQASLALLAKLAPQAVVSHEGTATLLCERLEYLPLALTLAGRLLANEAEVPRRLQRLVDELTEKAEARLGLLQAEGRLGLAEDDPVSLRAILGMSVERLSRQDQERFAKLAVLGGEPLFWDADDVALVWECSTDEADATISRFIQRGLVEPWQYDHFRMHALLADYAETLLNEWSL